jgi:hypothetical protein
MTDAEIMQKMVNMPLTYERYISGKKVSGHSCGPQASMVSYP